MSPKPSPSLAEGAFVQLPSPPMTPNRNSQATLQALDEDATMQNDKIEEVVQANQDEKMARKSQESAVVEEESVQQPIKHGWRTYAAFATLCLVTFIVALDSTIICVAIPVSLLLSFLVSAYSPPRPSQKTSTQPPSKPSGAAPASSSPRPSSNPPSPPYHTSSAASPRSWAPSPSSRPEAFSPPSPRTWPRCSPAAPSRASALEASWP